MIVKMGNEWGGTAFTNPDGPIYPNTEWHPHVCDPRLVRERKALHAGARIMQDFPQAHAMKIGNLGFVIIGEDVSANSAGCGSYLVISAHQTFSSDMEGAWTSALERSEKGWPSWHIDLGKYAPGTQFGNDLDKLPEIPS
jgi:hypothetical protein